MKSDNVRLKCVLCAFLTAMLILHYTNNKICCSFIIVNSLQSHYVSMICYGMQTQR